MFEHQRAQHEMLLDGSATVRRRELDADGDRIGFVFPEAEAVDGGGVPRHRWSVRGDFKSSAEGGCLKSFSFSRAPQMRCCKGGPMRSAGADTARGQR
jgi:hypothetical protein